MAPLYGATVILHTDHAARNLLPWVDGMLDAGEAHYEAHGEPLFSSHMIDLSAEPIEQNIETCKRYLERMSKLGMTLEIELGVTGGEEDGVDNTGVDSSRLYTQPDEVAYAYREPRKVGGRFTVAAFRRREGRLAEWASERRRRFWGLHEFTPEQLTEWMAEVGLSHARCLHAAGGWLIMSAVRESGDPPPGHGSP